MSLSRYHNISYHIYHIQTIKTLNYYKTGKYICVNPDSNEIVRGHGGGWCPLRFQSKNAD